MDFLYVEDDFDGKRPRDDSGLPDTQKCPLALPATLTARACWPLWQVLSLAVPRMSKPILVRVPRRAATGKGASAEDWLQAVRIVADQFQSNSATTVAILSLSWIFTLKEFTSRNGDRADGFLMFRIRLGTLLRELIKKGVFVVVGSGNTLAVGA